MLNNFKNYYAKYVKVIRQKTNTAMHFYYCNIIPCDTFYFAVNNTKGSISINMKLETLSTFTPYRQGNE